MLFGGFSLYNIIPVCLSHSRAITRTANDRAINHPQAKVQALTENMYSVVCVKAIMTWQTGGLRENVQYTQYTVHTSHMFKMHINIFIAEYKQPYQYFITNIILKITYSLIPGDCSHHISWLHLFIFFSIESNVM